VAIIVAALAAVAVPMYTSYVSSSRVNAAANAAGSVASFMGSCINQTGHAVGTGISAAVESPGTASAILDCQSGANVSISSMQLPTGIKFLISSFTTNGFVRATHVSSTAPADTAHYNY
jgi:Tfp pilus assembly protein PilE